MLRMTKQTDYGLVLLTHLARSPRATWQNGRDLAQGTQLPAPMVNKILKLLTAEGLLSAKRGVKGGYALARSAADITVAQIIDALEGPMAITECSLPDVEEQSCERESFCQVRGHTQRINNVILSALSGVTLAELAGPLTPNFFTMQESALPAHIAARPVAKSVETGV